MHIIYIINAKSQFNIENTKTKGEKLKLHTLLLITTTILFFSCSNVEEKIEINPFAIQMKEDGLLSTFTTNLKISDSLLGAVEIVSMGTTRECFIVSELDNDTIHLPSPHSVSYEDVKVLDSTFLEIRYRPRMGSNGGGALYTLISFDKSGNLIKSVSIYNEYLFYYDNHYYPGAPEIDYAFEYKTKVEYLKDKIFLEETVLERYFDDSTYQARISCLKYDPEKSIFYNVIDSNGIYGIELMSVKTQNDKQKYINGKWIVVEDVDWEW